MKHIAFRWILIVLGEALLLAVLFLLFPKASLERTAVDAFFLSVAYLGNVLGYPSLSKRQSESAPASYGISWLGTWLYSGATLLFVIVSYHVGISMTATVIVYGFLLLLYLVFLYWGSMAASHASSLEARDGALSQGIRVLKERAVLLQTLLPEQLDEDLRTELTGIAERMNYLIPNASPVATELESQLNVLLDSLINRLQSAVPSGPELSDEIKRCKMLLKQRMALHNRT